MTLIRAAVWGSLAVIVVGIVAIGLFALFSHTGDQLLPTLAARRPGHPIPATKPGILPEPC